MKATTTTAPLKIRVFDATVTVAHSTTSVTELGYVTAFAFVDGAPRITITLHTEAVVVISQEMDAWNATHIAAEGDRPLDDKAFAALAGGKDLDRVHDIIDELWTIAWSLVTQIAEQAVGRLALPLGQLLAEHA